MYPVSHDTTAILVKMRRRLEEQQRRELSRHGTPALDDLRRVTTRPTTRRYTRSGRPNG